MTVTLQIGNSDNKLTQQEWARFVLEIKKHIEDVASKIHFFGGSSTWETWQNVCWVFEMSPLHTEYLKDKIPFIKKRFSQDSVALTFGTTEFV